MDLRHVARPLALGLAFAIVGCAADVGAAADDADPKRLGAVDQPARLENILALPVGLRVRMANPDAENLFGPLNSAYAVGQIFDDNEFSFHRLVGDGDDNWITFTLPEARILSHFRVVLHPDYGCEPEGYTLYTSTIRSVEYVPNPETSDAWERYADVVPDPDDLGVTETQLRDASGQPVGREVRHVSVAFHGRNCGWFNDTADVAEVSAFVLPRSGHVD